MSAALSTVFALARRTFRLVKSTAGRDSAATKEWVVLQHTPRLVLYQGSDTYVPITLFAVERKDKPAPPMAHGSLQIQLVQRGWRAGLFGWAVAKWLGAKTVKGLDVTPAVSHHRSGAPSDDVASAERGMPDPQNQSANTAAVVAKTSFPERAVEKWDKDVARFVSQQAAEHYEEVPWNGTVNKLVPVGTFAVRIPARAGDGYFRLSLRFGHGSYAVSPDFRIYSLSLSSASPRGAALLPPTLVPELLLRTASTALYTALLGLFPVAALMEKILPRGTAGKLLSWFYRALGLDRKADQMIQQYHVQERVEHAKVQVLETVPFSSAGIRTDYDLQKDAALGRGGVTYWRHSG